MGDIGPEVAHYEVLPLPTGRVDERPRTDTPPERERVVAASPDEQPHRAR